jgi:hypothetical protein
VWNSHASQQPGDRDFFDLEKLMRKVAIGLIVATSIVAPGAGHAQVTLDMTQVTCANYLAV